jgi:hypothetical protein
VQPNDNAGISESPKWNKLSPVILIPKLNNQLTILLQNPKLMKSHVNFVMLADRSWYLTLQTK